MNTLTLAIRLELEKEPDADDYLHIVTDLRVDGLCVVSPGDYDIDIAALSASTTDAGDHFIITCTCGIAGCGGIYRGVEVTRRDGELMWHITKPGPERQFRFNTDQYRKTIAAAIDDFRSSLQGPHALLESDVLVFPYGNAYYFGLSPLQRNNDGNIRNA